MPAGPENSPVPFPSRPNSISTAPAALYFTTLLLKKSVT